MSITPYREGMETISIRVPADIMRDIRILLLDPSTGQIGYGRLRNLVTGLLAGWLEEKKKGIDEAVLVAPEPDKFEPFNNEGD